MKKVIAGGFLLFSGVILYISVHIPAASLAATLGGWSSPPGRLGTALAEMGGTATRNGSLILMFIGALLILWGAFEEELRRFFKSRKSSTKRGDHELP